AGTFGSEFAELDRDEHLVAEMDTTLERDLEEHRRKLNALAAEGEVVTQAEVSKARGERDRRWAEVRRIYVNRVDEPQSGDAGAPPAQASAEDFERAMHEADRLADLLRAGTERAATLEATRQRIAALEAAMRRNAERRDELAARRQELQRRWDFLIAPLRRPELTPAAMRDWLSRHQRLIERHRTLDGLRPERSLVDDEIAQARSLLDSALLASGLPASRAEESGAALLARAQR